MVPSWIRTALVIFLGCIFACYIGSTLPEYEYFGGYLLLLAIACTVCAVLNNLPLLMAMGIWYPFAPPVPGFGSFPTFALVLMWVAFIKFFRTCMAGTIRYVRSFNTLLLVCFAWVPIRFLLNPVHKLGATVAGGSGVSGANAYFGYALAGVTLISVGAILNTREDLCSFVRWCFRICFLIGIGLFICAFIPATAPFLSAMGMFAAGDLEDGIQRLVSLPAYGGFLFEAALCPALFRLNKVQSTLLILVGLAMMIVGGNRSSMTTAMFAVPVLLFLRGKKGALVVSLCLLVAFSGLIHVAVNQMNEEDIPPLARSLGVLNSKIDDASGGKASAEWRYAVWQSGWDIIMQHPLIGKGFGNLDLHLDTDPSHLRESTDFEAILAGGEAHNGFVVAAYGFGIPFTIGLTLAIFLAAINHTISALTADPHDPELRDFHAYLGCQFITSMLIIYSAIDLSVSLLWLQVGMGIVLTRVTRRSTAKIGPPIVPHKVEPRQGQMAPLISSRSA